MESKARRSDRLLTGVAALAVATATFLGGCGAAPASTTGTATTTAPSTAASTQAAPASSVYAIDNDLRARINRGELETLELVDGPIYVTGHRSPDSDTVSSCIAYASLLSKLGYDARPVVLGDLNPETQFILKECGLEVPGRIEDVSGANVILVDHSEYEHSAEGLKDANIITIIDHHGDGAITTSNPLIYDARPIGATATIVWLRYVNYGVEPDAAIAKLLMGGILSDTINLKSKTTTTADREALKILASAAGVDDTDAFFANQYKASISYEGKTDAEIFNSDVKTYESGGHRYAIGVINVYTEEEAKDMASRMKAVMPEQIQALGVEYGFAQVSVFHDDISLCYLVPANDASSEVLKAAYGDTATFDGTSYVITPGISRKTKLVPDIDAVLSSYPTE